MEFVSLDKFMAQDDGHEVPEPATDPTWEELVALDSRFADLLNLARSYHKSRRRRFCANHVYVWELKPRLEDLAGCTRRWGPKLLRTEAAYDVARESMGWDAERRPPCPSWLSWRVQAERRRAPSGNPHRASPWQ